MEVGLIYFIWSRAACFGATPNDFSAEHIDSTAIRQLNMAPTPKQKQNSLILSLKKFCD
ncbi:hypothetical protein FC85_GL001963 [Lentilactobacillus diolivorans DSM 14421]|uniref:Uncharacterized protein n=1 Tax=Lentilactobacillus diolivorans DSM 14421 TaxID=1423739 RepID=A0A0R1RZX7_9LACO|nr:hypothetical protein FC85_GL001963 [Lentilactobacillus diolivorans DSM 14421]